MKIIKIILMIFQGIGVVLLPFLGIAIIFTIWVPIIPFAIIAKVFPDGGLGCMISLVSLGVVWLSFVGFMVAKEGI